MKIKALAFVGIPVTDIKRAREFYEGVLDLKVSDEMMGGKWIEYSVGEDTLAIAENFEDAIKRLKDRHVRFAAEPFETPCCRMTVVQDPDGNKLIIHKLKPENEKGVCK